MAFPGSSGSAIRHSRWAALAASVWIQSFSGTSYCFGIYSAALKSSQGYSQSTLDTVGFFKDIGANVGILSGLLYTYSSTLSRGGPWVVLAAGAVQCFAGFFPTWLAVVGLVNRPPVAVMCLYMFLASHGQTFSNTTNAVVGVQNFPDHRGLVVGLMKGFLGLSGAILIQVYRTFFNGNPSSFILMLAILPTIAPLLLMYFVRVHPTDGLDEKRLLDALSVITLIIAGFRMLVIIGENLLVLGSLARILMLVILLMLLFSPVSIVIKAQSWAFKRPFETSSQEKIRLIQDTEQLEGQKIYHTLPADKACLRQDTPSKLPIHIKVDEASSSQALFPEGVELNPFQAMRTLDFWLLFLSMACGMGTGLATVNNISQIGYALGYPSTATGTLVSLFSIWNFLGRFGSGYISDYFLHLRGCARPLFIALTLVIMSFGHAIIAFGLPGALIIGSMLVGVCYGSQWSLMPSITSEIFGIKHFGTIFNTIAIASPMGSYILSVKVVGSIYDTEASSEGKLSCTGAPVVPKSPLSFCGYNGSSCCNVTDDLAVRKQFGGMNISDLACGSVVKSILCAKCDPYSAELFNIDHNTRTIPVLCNSTFSASSFQSKDAAKDFCAQVWETCKNVPIQNSPFAPSLQGSAGMPVSSSKLVDLWQSEADFIQAFGGSSDNESVCFDGKSASFNITPDSSPPKGLCLERIGNGSYISMAAHPDGSNRVFLSNQAGLIWLATIPEQGSGGTLELDESNPFLDLTDELHYDSGMGLMGLAFHPKFGDNGRFFVSFNCDKVQSASCSGRCSCNSDVGCDPSKLGTDNSAQPCQYQSVIAEFSANGSSSSPSMATSASPSEVRRIFTMGLPYTSHHGGQILFGPTDGYLYFMMGDGGNKGDPFNFAQNKKSLLGKVMRIDIDDLPSQSQINDLGLWGNYSIPKDNPSVDDSKLQAEIWALGLRNPWRCSFDSDRPSYFYCADIGQETYEEIDLITKGGNYGWRVYEGPELFNASWTPGGNTSVKSIDAISPVMGYLHSSVNNKIGSASIIGGYVYRSTTDPCMFGRYLYSDLYAAIMWAGIENPENSGNYSTRPIPFSCAKDSPIPCDTVAGSPIPSLGYIYSYGEDNSKDVYILASQGLYRVVRPSRCNYVCSKETNANNGNSPPGPSSAPQMNSLREVVILIFALSVLLIG